MANCPMSKDQMSSMHMSGMNHSGHHGTASVSKKEGKGTGVITAIDLKGKTVTLRHGDIPKIMAAMTMPYKLDRAEVMKGLKVGDSVTFLLQDRGDGNYFVTKIHKHK